MQRRTCRTAVFLCRVLAGGIAWRVNIVRSLAVVVSTAAFRVACGYMQGMYGEIMILAMRTLFFRATMMIVGILFASFASSCRCDSGDSASRTGFRPSRGSDTTNTANTSNTPKTPKRSKKAKSEAYCPFLRIRETLQAAPETVSGKEMK